MTPSTKRKDLGLVLFSCGILVVSSASTAFGLWAQFRVLFSAGGPNAWSYVEAFRSDFTRFRTVNWVNGLLQTTEIAIGDVLMLWRCFIFWRDKKWVVLFPFLSLCGSIACGVVTVVWIEPEYQNRHFRIADKANVACASLSVAMNIMVTVLILVPLSAASLGLSRLVSGNDREQRRMLTPYSRVTAILVESCAPLALFGICWIAVRARVITRPPETLVERGRWLVADWIFGWLYPSFCVLSPQMIILRVTMGRSCKNAMGVQDRLTPSPIDFVYVTESRASEMRDDI